jgi:hypothetical protein
MNGPRTLQEAKTYRYGRWSGNENGHPFRPGQCAYSVTPRGGWHSQQCVRRAGFGPEKLFCQQHAKKAGE